MNRQMPSKGGDPRKHNRSVFYASIIVKDCKQALSQPNVPPHLRAIVKGYLKTYIQADRRKTASRFVLAG